MRVLVAVTTYAPNLDLFWAFESSLNRARWYMQQHTEAEINLIVLDFSSPQQEDFSLPSWATRLILPDYGFPDNFNIAKNVALVDDYHYLCFCNDDIILHEKFLDNAIYYLDNNPDVGFLGGASQRGVWNERLDPQKVPSPTFSFEDLNDLSRLNWEFSACVIREEALRDTGDFDRMFSPKIGLCADNDYLYRMRRMGWRTVRSEWSTFFHAKAMTQAKLRNPMDPHDPHRLRAVHWMYLKWGVDIRMGMIVKAAFHEPFNGAKLEIINDNKILLDGEEINLEVCE
jgi:hypothetical protein